MIWLLLGCTSPATLSPSVEEAAVAAGEEVDADLLYGHVEALVQAHQGEEPVVRDEYGSDGLGPQLPHRSVEAGRYVAETFSSLGLEPTLETLDRGGIETTNVYVELPGRLDSLVLLTAHHDVWYTSADDDSTGVAVLLEAARVLRQHELEHTVRIVSFDREEDGLHGSRRHYEAHGDEEIVGVIFLDSLGFTSASQTLPTGFAGPEKGDWLLAVANEPATGAATWAAQLAPALGMPLYGGVAPGGWKYPAVSAVRGGDHAPAWDRGIPGVYLSDTGPYRNPNYHEETDLPETLDRDFLGRAGALSVALTLAMAESL